MRLKCTVCKGYVDEDSAIRRGIVSFCSQECIDDQRLNRKRVEKSPQRKAPTRRKNRSGVRGYVREAVFSADGNACRFCGFVQMRMERHHVYYRSEASHQPWLHEKHNLLTLCSECHALVHSNKKRYQPLALGVIWLREVTGDRSTTIPYLETQLQGASIWQHGR